MAANEGGPEGSVKPQLDEGTGEIASKNELQKRIQKRAKEGGCRGSREARSTNYSLQVITRFSPELNGYLQLGHAKAIAINFGFARYHKGKTDRIPFDDTNTTKEEGVYFVAIEEAIRWLEKLIELRKSYVCHCQEAELKRQHGGEKGKEGPRYRCEHADQDVATNLRKFRDMRDGKYVPREAFLRMKQDITNGNPEMWDLAAYRIPQKPTPHYRTGTQWKIYPTYDFAHCLCDSFENITHNLCITEFVLSQESYEWLNHTLGIYEPIQREYGRLNIAGAIMRKRIIADLVEANAVRGWNDPRVPPGAILAFINELGVTTSQTIIKTARFEQAVRRYLETSVPRLMLVLDPVPVVIEDWEELEKEVDAPLSIPYLAKATSFSQDPTSGLTKKKPKASMQWVSEGSQVVEVRVQRQLFNSNNPKVAEGGFLNDINPDNETVYPSALVEAAFQQLRGMAPLPDSPSEREVPGPESVRFQGHTSWAIDSDSTDDLTVLNRIVSLKEDSTKV
ncbi:glutaminyl-tRNA synthetase [Podospora didyma]|uniref:glutamine--tRNA ligase n=1 Tax=Podospora didyma TaxID=330526 RepID=A0AAE0KE95_9PEZI|nr:glutaminyl-tRNA synthetase [Podospora didyma]